MLERHLDSGELARLVKVGRLRVGLTQEELATRAQLSIRTVRNVEGGSIASPRLHTVRLLAEALEAGDRETAEMVAAATLAEVNGSAYGPDRPGGDESRSAALNELPPTMPARTVPAQLPADIWSFTGRHAELQRLDELLATAGEQPTAVVIAVVSGVAGAGKSALAVHWAHQVRTEFPDGQLYVNLRGFDPSGSAVKPIEAIRGFLDAMAVPPQRIPASLEAQTGMYRSLVADKRLLVVLDNARDADQVRQILPGAPGCMVLVTSRSQLAGLVATGCAHPLTLDVLAAADARELLTRRFGVDRAAAEPAAVDQIVVECARLPLALAIVGARGAVHPEFPLAALADELRAAQGGLDALAGEDGASNVRVVFSWSYQTLSPDAMRLFRLLGLQPGPDIATSAVVSLAGVPIEQVRPVLAELTRANMVTERSPGRFTFHDLHRSYATELAYTIDTDSDRRAALHRVLDHYLFTAHAAAVLVNPTRDPVFTPNPSSPLPAVTPERLADSDRAGEWLIRERAAVLAAIRQATDAGFDTHAWQLTRAIADSLHRQGHWHDSAETEQAALDATRRLGDKPRLADAHRGLARAYTRLGQYDDAEIHFRQALDLLGELGDPAGQAHTHRGIAVTFDLRRQHEDALRHALLAHELYVAADHREGQARTLNDIGWDYAQLGEYGQALTYCQQALRLVQETGDRRGEADTWDSLGYTQHHLGHHQQAAACYRQAIDLCREGGYDYFEAATLTRLGDLYDSDGDPDTARDAWGQALSILDGLGHDDADQVRAKINRSAERTAGDPMPGGNPNGVQMPTSPMSG